ncbi:hypothetical protein [Polaromonas naphthalenivorans]|uniref:Uncharacterized protein n=1 Tax=Polaromonas naphthalenivorans (strain CJ2) TaxID=365044 RepID=A1VPJ8_POLNA|nr:hypothetical protein [Polaromonas naphthalenivorans]ABM37576.1 hypothetical protein Pnap_2268 [Polaromonas naphthalenivorans CJ2]
MEALSPTRADARTPAEIDSLMEKAFFVGRVPRSEQYRQGVHAILDRRLCGASIPPMPYNAGTCEADAYFSGQDEGHFIARRVLGLEA